MYKVGIALLSVSLSCSVVAKELPDSKFMSKMVELSETEMEVYDAQFGFEEELQEDIDSHSEVRSIKTNFDNQRIVQQIQLKQTHVYGNGLDSQ